MLRSISVTSLTQTLAPDLRVIVVNAAKSNGTLLCLAAKVIVMGATSELGPIEPAVNNTPCTILSQPEIAQQNYGVYALQQTKALAKRLLMAGMMKGKQETEVAAVVQQLSSRDKYFSHGSVINHAEAKSLGLTVEDLPPEGQLKMWLLYCMYDHDCRRDRYRKVTSYWTLRRLSARSPNSPSSTRESVAGSGTCSPMSPLCDHALHENESSGD
jgi:hypothetical protein